MISTTGARRAAELRALLNDGALRDVGHVETLHGLSADAELAARLVLAHLDYLMGVEGGIASHSARWRAVEEDLRRLHGAVTLARRAAAVPA